MKVTARARSREDRAGDPLDLTSALTEQTKAERSERAQQSPVVVDRDQAVQPFELEPGERVVGRGKPLGTVYRLADGRTVIVHEP